MVRTLRFSALALLLAAAPFATGYAADKGPSPEVGTAGVAPGAAPNASVKGSRADDANQVERVNGNEPEIPPPVSWSFAGLFGHYDKAQLQRGYQVYREVCSNCHSMKLVAFRNLAGPGGLGYGEGQVAALAATFQIEDGPNDKGEMYKRPGRPADIFPSPFPNPEAAAAAYGKAPPDMSVLAKARYTERGLPWFIFDFFTQAEEVSGPTYIHAVLNGYTKPDDPKYNIYMPNHAIAMPKPLNDGQVEYKDDSPQTLEQYSKDVSAFLMWAAEPKLQQRKAMGLMVLSFLTLFTGLLYFVKKRIWARVGGDVLVGDHGPRPAGSAGGAPRPRRPIAHPAE